MSPSHFNNPDIEGRLNPDIAGSVLNYELLEHLPYEGIHKALSEIFRVFEPYAVLSLPDVKRVYRFDVQIPKLREIKRLITLPRFKKLVHKYDGEHYWEIGKAGYPLSKIVNDIQRAGFKIEKTYRVFEHSCHRFFILKKTN